MVRAPDVIRAACLMIARHGTSDAALRAEQRTLDLAGRERAAAGHWSHIAAAIKLMERQGLAPALPMFPMMPTGVGGLSAAL